MTKKAATSKKPAAKKAPARKRATAKAPARKKATTKAKAAVKAAAKPSQPQPPAPLPAATKRRTVSRKKKVAAKPKPKPGVPLTIEEMQTEDLWGLYQIARNAEDKTKLERIRNVLMERHIPLVRYIAERLLQTLPKSIELDDLVSAGLFGLMDAIRGFDPLRGIKFKTYCTTRIRGSILDQLRSQDWVPRLVRLKASKIDKALQALTGEYGREPTHAELAQALELDHGELTKEMSAASAKAMYSLSDKWEDRDDDSSMEKVDVLEDKKSTDPISDLNKADMMTYITRSLTHKERFIIEQYYRVGHTMREIGEMLSLTESRVCQIHSNVMARLKSLFGSKTTTLLL